MTQKTIASLLHGMKHASIATTGNSKKKTASRKMSRPSRDHVVPARITIVASCALGVLGACASPPRTESRPTVSATVAPAASAAPIAPVIKKCSAKQERIGGGWRDLQAIASTGDSIFFNAALGDSGASAGIFRAPAGGSAPAPIVRDRPVIRSLAAGAGFVVWGEGLLEDAAIVAAPINGGAPRVLATAFQVPQAVVVGGDDAFFVATVRGKSVVQRAPLRPANPGDAKAATTIYTGDRDFFALASNATDLFVNDGGIVRIPQHGGAARRLVEFKDQAVLAADDAFVYFTGALTTDPSDVRRVAIAGGAVQTLAAKQVDVGPIATDGHHVYWFASGSLHRASTDGSNDEVLTTQAGTALAVTLDDQCVYWADVAGGGIASAKIVDKQVADPLRAVYKIAK